MKKAIIEITLQDEIVLSERSATEGGHRSLDFVPGGTLLGAVAAKLYATHPEKAHLLFHSGSLRFGNAYPVINGQRTLPCPLSLHYNKQDKGSILNFLAAKFEENIQPKQMRTGFVVIDGQSLHMTQPQMAMRMKTAVDTATGHVRDGHLYGYQSLLAGQQFQSEIQADDSVPDSLWQEVLDVLTAGIRIGRSKAQQYGRAQCRVLESAKQVTVSARSQSNKLVVWVVSDLAVLDENGMPCFVPHRAALLGLPAGRLNSEQSFIRTRRYSAYNSFRKSYDSERLVIQQGSVLTYDLDQPLAEDAQLPTRIGLLREAGLGEVFYNPSWAERKLPFLSVKAVPEDQSISRPEGHFLLEWLSARLATQSQQSELLKRAEIWLADYLKALSSAVSYQALDSAVWHGPGASQWGRVEEKAKQYQDLDPLCHALFEADDAVCKTNGRSENSTSTETHEAVSQDWGLQINGDQSIRDWLRITLRKDGANSAAVLAMLAGKIQQQIKSGNPNYQNQVQGAQQ